MRDLNELDKNQIIEFFNSFDNVLFDCDGVLLLGNSLIPGADQIIQGLKLVNKNIAVVTNNSSYTSQEFKTKLEKHGIDIKADNIIFPTKCLISYLKKLNLEKLVYIISSESAIKEFSANGIRLYHPPSSKNGLQLDSIVSERNNHDVGVVVLDLDLNLNLEKLSRALILLTNHKKVKFLVGATDDAYPVGKHVNFIGPGNFVNILTKHSGIKPLCFAKPSDNFKEFLFEELKIIDPGRTLFIGDSMESDMLFATKCNFQKMLVLSGASKKDDLDKYESNVLPNYVANSVQDMVEKLKYLY